MKEILQRNFSELKVMNIQIERVYWVPGTMTRILEHRNKERGMKTSREEKRLHTKN